MLGTDGTGPVGFGPLTGGRLGRCGGDVPAGVRFEGTGSGAGIARGRGGGQVEPGRSRRKGGVRGTEGSLSGRTATRALVAIGAYVAQDLRDAEGLTRPLLRWAALRLALSRREPARRLGSAYLRLDPPAPDDVRPRGDAIEARNLIAVPGAYGGARHGGLRSGQRDAVVLKQSGIPTTMSIC
jgi:hypothetical protein